MLDFARKYGHNITSQNGENGIIDECIRRIKPELKVAVEFGAPDQMFCSNIYPLREKGWSLYYFDDKAIDPFITKKEITIDNINDLPNCSILSMDTDGMDYLLWIAYKKDPDIVIIEINSSFAPTVEHFTKEQGASYRTMCKLAKSKGYFILCHTGNVVCLLEKHRHLFHEVGDSDAVEDWAIYFNTLWLK